MSAQQTLYLKNLPDKVRKEELRRSLYLMFSQFGPVVDIVVMKTSKARGQAWVVFADTQSCTTALQAVDGKQSLYGKVVEAAYAKESSFVVDPAARVRRNQRLANKKQEVVLEALAGRKRPRE
jgi:U2 small nuclear ribonucleoprotein B''